MNLTVSIQRSHFGQHLIEDTTTRLLIVILMCVFMLSLIVPCDIVSCDIMPRLVAPFYNYPTIAVTQGQQQIWVGNKKRS